MKSQTSKIESTIMTPCITFLLGEESVCSAAEVVGPVVSRVHILWAGTSRERTGPTFRRCQGAWNTM